MTLAELNALDRRHFVDAVGGVFEHSPWVAERAWPHRPFASIEALHHAMNHEVLRADREAQLALLRAHPDLGARARMSDSSTAEQAGAGLDRLTPTQFQRLVQLNTAYRVRFDFPFLYAVKGSTVEQILKALETRLSADPDREFAEALRQVARIAGFRLQQMLEVRKSGT